MQMWTQSAELVHLAALIAVTRNRLPRLRMQHAAIPRHQILYVRDILLHKALVLRIDLHVVVQHRRQALHDGRHSRRGIQLRPRIRRVGDEIRDQFPREHAVREPVAAVPRHHVRVLSPLVQPDERHVVDGFEHLPAPLVVYGACLREACACPGFELRERGEGVALPDLVVAAAHHQIIVAPVTRGESHVFVRVGGVVQQAVLDGAARDAHSDAVCAVARLLHYDRQLLQRHAGCFDGVGTLDRVSVHRLDVYILMPHPQQLDALLLDVHDARVRIRHKIRLVRQKLQHADAVLGRMERRLSLVHDRIPLVHLPRPPPHAEPFPILRLQAQRLRLRSIGDDLLHIVGMLPRRARILRYVVPGKFPVLAVYAQQVGYLAHAIDGPGVALGRQLRAVIAVLGRDGRVAVVEVAREVARSAACFAGEHVARFEEDHVEPARDELVGRRDAGYAGPDDAHVRLDVFLQAREGRPVGVRVRVDPDGVGGPGGALGV